MTARLYADAIQLAACPGGESVPAESTDELLRTASKLVDELLRLRAYPTDDADLPTDADDAAAMRDATCAIAIELHETGATNPGQTQQWDSVGIGSVALSGRKLAPGASLVLGLPVPAVALVHLSDVGRPYVSTGRRYSRPLDRVAR